MEYQKVLKEWGLSAFADKFEDEGINDESFDLLDEDTINQIFKRAGPKLIFKKKYFEYKYGKNLTSPINITPTRELTDDTESLSSCGSKSSYTCSDDGWMSQSFIEKDLTHLFNKPPTTEPSEYVFKVPSLNPSDVIIPTKKPKISSVFGDSLENILNQSTEGRLILMAKNKLGNDQRQKMSKIVVNELLSSNKNVLEISREKFLKAAEEIINLFPREQTETYYVPFSSGKSGLRQPARGKLWSRYLNVKAAMRVANQQNLAVDSKGSDHDEVEITTEVKNQLTFLSSAIEPFPKIHNAWENTHSQRKLLYAKASIEKIFEEFPCLKQQIGIDLLESDFNIEHEEKIDIIYQEWPKISMAVLKEARERNIQAAKETDLDGTLQALLVLPFLFSPINLKNPKNKNCWRPTRNEVQESFFFHVQNYSDLTEMIERRKAKLDQFKVPLQPFGVAIGPLNNIEHFYIFVLQHKYTCDSAIRCLELLFKAIHALNLEYPAESKHIWYFIEEMVFKMPVTGKHSSTASVITDIKFHLANDAENTK